MVEVAMVQTYKGRRDFMFPPLPDAMTTKQQFALMSQFAKQELVSRGMVCQTTLYENGEAMFSCPTREVTKEGFGEVVEEWGTLAFFIQVKEAFSRMVNDELEKMGQPRSYQFI